MVRRHRRTWYKNELMKHKRQDPTVSIIGRINSLERYLLPYLSGSFYKVAV